MLRALGGYATHLGKLRGTLLSGEDHELCERVQAAGHEALVRERTGLVLDPYFSASKIEWLMKNVDGAGRAKFGTIDSWLTWQLTGGVVHATDVSNASRTMLFDIHRNRWDEELLALLEIPREVLPTVAGIRLTEMIGAPVSSAAAPGPPDAAHTPITTTTGTATSRRPLIRRAPVRRSVPPRPTMSASPAPARSAAGYGGPLPAVGADEVGQGHGHLA